MQKTNNMSGGAWYKNVYYKVKKQGKVAELPSLHNKITKTKKNIFIQHLPLLAFSICDTVLKLLLLLCHDFFRIVV